MDRIVWIAETQKELMKTKLKERIKKSRREGYFLNHLVDQCKGHGGPITKVEELRALPTASSSTLKNRPHGDPVPRDDSSTRQPGKS